MRFLKIASNKNPENDYILLNGGYFDKDGKKNLSFRSFEGFLCTNFQTLGISRKLEFLAIKNRQFAVDNKTNFKKYSLSIEILSKYSEYERLHSELITFLDRNKKSGFRLYFRPYGENPDDIRYCLCDIESSQKPEKMKPIVLSLTQNSLWICKEQSSTTAYTYEEKSNLFAFDDIDDNGYYSAGFVLDEEVQNYYCVSFYSSIETATIIDNEDCYNEIPLKIKIYGECINPTVSLFRINENTPIRRLQIYASIDSKHYIEINSTILENGVWLVDKNTGEKISYDEKINNAYGSPYFYIDNGSYRVEVKDDGNNVCLCEVFWQKEYEE